ncbi:hypothetical protein ACFLQG_01325 [Candidatus Zixiibacteriota bacterium]
MKKLLKDLFWATVTILVTILLIIYSDAWIGWWQEFPSYIAGL